VDFAYNINDLEAFINGLRFSFDQLNKAESEESKGFQFQLARVISNLRVKKRAIIEQNPSFNARLSKEDMKKVLHEQLEQMKVFLENCEYNSRKRSEMLLKIEYLDKRINNL